MAAAFGQMGLKVPPENAAGQGAIKKPNYHYA